MTQFRHLTQFILPHDSEAIDLSIPAIFIKNPIMGFFNASFNSERTAYVRLLSCLRTL